MRVAVIGAGAFGGWSALALARRGVAVTLVDAWGTGHTRASSGGDTRVIRAAYGSRRVYTSLAVRALDLWREHDRRYGRALYRRTGAVYLFGADDRFGHASAEQLAAEGVAFEWLPAADAAARFPQFAYDGVASVLYEPEAGYLLARRACAHVAALVAAKGGAVRTAAVAAPVSLGLDGRRVDRISTDAGGAIEADAFVFACGPWLGRLFPEVVGPRVTPTRQEVYYFGTPPGDARFSDAGMPAWLDLGDRMIYGIPGNAQRGFKIADDTPGPPFDPTNGSRALTPGGIDAARAFLARRFPALAAAPLLGGEVCQYEATPDSHFIVDRHPLAANVWIAGGGSGHGFKMGPAIGEIVAAAILDGRPPADEWRLARFDAGPVSGDKWA